MVGKVVFLLFLLVAVESADNSTPPSPNSVTVIPLSPGLKCKSKPCGLNQFRTNCPVCEKTCDNPQPSCLNDKKSCFKKSFCRCSPGFYRNFDYKCVPKKDCPDLSGFSNLTVTEKRKFLSISTNASGTSSSPTPTPLQPQCPINGTWSSWTSGDKCADHCGACAQIKSTRTCTSEPSGCPCVGETTKMDYCNIQPCAHPRKSCCKPFKARVFNRKIVCGPLPGDADFKPKN